MTDGPKIHPRTAEMHQTWRLRNQQRRQSKAQARTINSKSEIKVAKVVGINEVGDVQIDRFTNADGVGQWFSPLNGRIPEVGQAVMYTYVEGAPLVIGSALGDQGKIAYRPNPEILLPEFVAPPTTEYAPFWDFKAVPQFEIDSQRLPVRFGAPPQFDPHYIWWSDHFVFGEQLWRHSGNGSMAERTSSSFGGRSHVIILQTGGSTGNKSCMHMTAASNARLVSRSDIYELWFFFTPGNSANIIVRVGAVEDVNAATWSNGAYAQVNSGILTAILKRSSGVTAYSSAFSDTLSGSEDVMMRIRCEQVPGAANQNYRKFTWDRLGKADGSQGYYDQVTGDFHIIERKEVTIDSSTGTTTDANVGVQVTTLNNVNRVVEVDYIGGWAVRRSLAVDAEVPVG